MTIPSEYTTYVAIGLGVSGVLGVLLNLVIFATLLHTKDPIFKNGFYIVVGHMTIADGLLLLNYVVVAAPLVLFQRKILSGVLEFWIANVDSITYNVLVVLLIIISLNRFFSIIGSFTNIQRFAIYKVFTDQKWLRVPLAFAWLWGVACAVGLAFGADCFKHYYFTEGNFGYNCSDYSDNNTIWAGYLLWHYLFEIFVFGLYIIIFLALKCQRQKARGDKQLSDAELQREKQRAKTERRMLFQAALVTGFHLLNNVAFFHFSSFAHWMGSVMISVAGILNSTSNPIIYWVFNPPMRRETRKLIATLFPWLNISITNSIGSTAAPTRQTQQATAAARYAKTDNNENGQADTKV